MKNVLITGITRGIGLEIAKKFAKNHYRVLGTYSSNETDAKIAENSLIKLNKNVHIFKCDVTVKEDLSNLKETLIQNGVSCIDVLVNNAGVNKPEDFDKITEDDWDYILGVNLKGPFLVTQIFWGMLVASKHGSSIINIGSISGQYGGPRTAHYAASKAGLISLSQVIARFGAKSGVRSNTIAVGIVESNMASAGLGSPQVSAMVDKILLGRLGSFSDVANAAYFLANEESKYITAQTINVNGGLYF